MLLDGINKVVTGIEMGFNISNNIPGRVGEKMSGVRCYFGVTQVALGVLTGVVGIVEITVGLVFSRNLRQHGWKVLEFGNEHIVHGCLNGFVGFTELSLHYTPFQIGSMVFFFMKAKRDFQPTLEYKMNYGAEAPRAFRQNVFPLPPMHPQPISQGGLYLVPIAVPPAPQAVHYAAFNPILVPGIVPPPSYG